MKAAEDWRASEIPNQIYVAARQPVSAGHVHYDLKALVRNADLCSTLERGAYMQPALVPASPWLGRGVTNRPEFFLSGMKSGDLRFTIKPAKGEDVARWALQTRVDGKWKTELLNGGTRAYHFDGAEPEVIAVTAVDRFGNSGTPVVMQKETSHVENHHH